MHIPQLCHDNKSINSHYNVIMLSLKGQLTHERTTIIHIKILKTFHQHQ